MMAMMGAQRFLPCRLSNLKCWYSVIRSPITKDGSNKVSQWNDISGNGYHLTQGTGANQPTYQASPIGIDFDGAVSAMKLQSGSSITITTPSTWGVAVRMGTITATNAQTMELNDGVRSTASATVASGASNALYYDGATRGNASGPSNLTSGNDETMMYRYDNSGAGNAIFYVNGSAGTPASTSTSLTVTNGRFTIGNNDGAAVRTWDGLIKEEFFFTGAKTDTQLAWLNEYLENFYS